ncbi:MAG: DUF4416 family protein [Candidatus Omnitrophica bacterium]|nr:DUF4416 family protein [Candidatus Omnitrophota bacterium]
MNFNEMGSIHKVLPVKLIVGFIFRIDDVFEKVKAILEKCFGKIDFESQTLAFTHTDYYEAEFGKDLKRKFISFKKLIPPQNLARIKIITNSIEKRFTQNKNRQVNLDPGYIDSAKLILASTKDYKHRIYLTQGIYAEVTLFFQNNTFQAWEWTYPDYKTPEYIEIFNQIRRIYREQITKDER